MAKPLPGCSRRCSRSCRCRTRLPGRYRAGRNAHAERGGDQEHDGQDDRVLDDHRGSPFWAASTARRSAVRADPAFRPTWGASAAEICATAPSGMAASGPCRSVTRARNRAVFVSPRGRSPAARTAAGLGRGDGRGGRGQAGGAAAGGDRAFLEHPGAEPGQRGRRGQASRSSHSSSPPTTASRVTSSSASPAAVSVPGDHPGPDDADQRVAGQRVGDRRHRPDRQVPPARRGRDHVHEHARARPRPR